MTSIFQAGQPFNIVRTSSTTYQANDKDLVISSGDEVALPSPNQGATILVRPAPSIGSVKITTSNGTIGNTGDTFGFYRATEPIYLVGDGTDWYARSGGGEISAIPDSGVARWEFEEDLSDSWGSNGGTNNGATFVTDSAAGNYALQFNPSENDYVSVGDNSALKGFSEFTLTVSAKPSSNQDGGIGKWDDENASGEYLLRTDAGNDAWHGDLEDSGGTIHSVEGGTITEGAYQFVALRWDGSTIYLDVDDTQVDTVSANVTLQTSNVPFEIGRYDTGRTYYDGILDDLRLYNKSLTDTELDNLRTTGHI